MNWRTILETLKTLHDGAPIRWRGEVLTFVAVELHRGDWVVWVEEINGPIPSDCWDELEVMP